MSIVNLGPMIYKWRGDYDANIAYVRYNVVRFDNANYVCAADAAAGESPTSAPTKWELMLEGAANIPSATTTESGIVELATVTEALAGTDATNAVTPAGLSAALGAVSQSVVQVKSDISTVQGSGGRQTFHDIGLSVSMTLTSSANSVLLLASMSCYFQCTGQADHVCVGLGMFRNGIQVFGHLGDSNAKAGSAPMAHNAFGAWIDTPGGTGSYTFDARPWCYANSNGTLYWNKERFTSLHQGGGTGSVLVAMEIAA